MCKSKVQPALAATLKLHARVDELTLAGRLGNEALVEVIGSALANLDFGRRMSLMSRLQTVVHESIADASSDPAALSPWTKALALPVNLQETCQKIVLQPPRPRLDDSCWTLILGFVASFDGLASGLHAVSRNFRQHLRQPVCWEGGVVTFKEEHFKGAMIRNESGWGQAFSMVPALRNVSSVRLGCFSDGFLRSQVLPPLRGAFEALCGKCDLLECSFCEHHAGASVELIPPKNVSARRKPGFQRGDGYLIGNGPLHEDSNGCRSFKVVIEHLPEGERIDIGVTALSPHEHFRKDFRSLRNWRFAEELSSCWVVESSGLLVGSYGGLRIRDSEWDARQLKVGDCIQLKITPEGEIELSVNGVRRGAWRAQIPAGRPVYPVVDLFEGSPRVTMSL